MSHLRRREEPRRHVQGRHGRDDAEYGAFTEDIRKSGHYIGGNALPPVQTATTVRVRQSKLSATDGP